MDEWLTAQEVAELLKVHPETVKRWLRAGALRGSYLSDRAGWRIRREEVDRFMRERENLAPSKSAGINETGKTTA